MGAADSPRVPFFCDFLMATGTELSFSGQEKDAECVFDKAKIREEIATTSQSL